MTLAGFDIKPHETEADFFVLSIRSRKDAKGAVSVEIVASRESLQFIVSVCEKALKPRKEGEQ